MKNMLHSRHHACRPLVIAGLFLCIGVGSASISRADFDPIGDMLKADEQKEKEKKSADLNAAVAGMLTGMDKASKSLKANDVGQVTMATQKDVVKNLDALIEYVRQQNAQPDPPPTPPKPQPGEKKSGPGKPGSQPGKGPPKDPKGTQAAQNSQAPSGTAEQPGGEADIHESRDAHWGNLPERDRDLITNGSQEKYLPTYQNAIQQYYQSLAEMSKSQQSK